MKVGSSPVVLARSSYLIILLLQGRRAGGPWQWGVLPLCQRGALALFFSFLGGGVQEYCRRGEVSRFASNLCSRGGVQAYQGSGEFSHYASEDYLPYFSPFL